MNKIAIRIWAKHSLGIIYILMIGYLAGYFPFAHCLSLADEPSFCAGLLSAFALLCFSEAAAMDIAYL